jgi:hypothetical protein
MHRLEAALRDRLDSFELEDGSRFYFDRTSGERFLHSMSCLRAQGEGKTTFPEPPPKVKAIARAKDRAAAFEKVYSGDLVVMPYDVQALIERGEFVPVSMVVGRELGEVAEDLSEQAKASEASGEV